VISGRIESTSIEIHPTYVKKFYNDRWRRFNREFKRKGEFYFLTKYQSPCFIKVLDYEEDVSITLENGGVPLETEDGIPFTQKDIDFFELVKWLYLLRQEFKRFKIVHRDVNPTNVLYNKDTKTFKLIDFSWAGEPGDQDGITLPRVMNKRTDTPRGIDGPNYYVEDDKSIEKMMILSIKRMIEDIASKGYRDGSSVNKGWLYHQVPFEEFSDTPFHKTAARDDYKSVLLHSNITDWSEIDVLDIGTGPGYFTFNLSAIAKSVVGMEGDTFVYKVAEAMRLLKDIENVVFLNCYLDENTIPEKDFDLVLFMNTHMWVYKQLGRERTFELMKKLANTTKRILFQTSGAESGGMFTVTEFGTSDDISKYLLDSGFTNVRLVNTTRQHGGKRYLFYAEGYKR